ASRRRRLGRPGAQRGRDGQARPGCHLRRRVHCLGGRAPVADAHLLAAAGVVHERLAAGGDEGRPRLFVGLEKDAVVDDEGNEQIVDVDAVPAEHAARARRSERGKQFHAVVRELVLGHGSSCTIGPIASTGPPMSEPNPDARKALRDRLVAARQALPDRHERAVALQNVLRVWLVSRPETTIGAYWPIKGEFDALPALYRWSEADDRRRIGLPVVDRATGSLDFHVWYPGCPMELDAHDIPKPKGTEKFHPQLLLLPCVG